MKFSFIVPVYNSALYLDECIKSILGQTYENFELILINDGSKDNSLEICEKYAVKDKRIVVLDHQNSGVSVARNRGIEHATGDWIIFVDSDDICSTNLLEIVKNELDDKILLVYGYERKSKYDSDYVVKNEKKIITEDLEEAVFCDSEISGYLWNKVFNCQIIKDNKLKFDKNFHFCEDMVFISKYIDFVEEIKCLNTSLYSYRLRKSSVSNNLITKKNSSILYSYQYLVAKYKDKLNLYNLFCFRYLICYYKFRKFLSTDEVDRTILREEKNILKNVSKKEKIKVLTIKHFGFVYSLFKKSNKKVSHLYD